MRQSASLVSECNAGSSSKEVPDVDLVSGVRRRRLLLQRGDETLGLQGLRPELEDEGAHLGEACLRQGRHVLQRLYGAGDAKIWSFVVRR
jgi:hypothetical protein